MGKTLENLEIVTGICVCMRTEYITDLIIEKWGDVKTFSKEIGLPYKTVRRTIRGEEGGMKRMPNIQVLSVICAHLGIDVASTYTVKRTEGEGDKIKRRESSTGFTVKVRTDHICDILKGRGSSVLDMSGRIGMNYKTVRRVIGFEEGGFRTMPSLNFLAVIADHLNLTIDELLEVNET